MEGPPPPGRSSQPYRPVMQRDERTRVRKSQSDPACNPAIVFHGHKRFEDTFLLLRVHSWPCICHPEMDMWRRDLCAQGNLSAFCIFLCVAQEIQEDLAQPNWISSYLWQIVRNVEFPSDVSPCGLICETMERI